MTFSGDLGVNDDRQTKHGDKTGTRRNVYMNEDTRQALIGIGMKAGAKEGRAASLGLRIAAMNHRALVEALQDMADIAEDLDIALFEEKGAGEYPGCDEIIEARALLAKIEGQGK